MSLSLIIIGVTGNLAKIKLIPALYDLAKNDLLPKNFKIVGVARKDMSQKGFENYFHEILHLDNRHHQHEIDEKIFENLCSKIEYLSGDIKDQALYKTLREKTHGGNKMFYLATFPGLYGTIFENIKSSGLASNNDRWTKIIIEKPMGTDLNSAKKLNNLLSEYFVEDEIFRLDHYLGKETMRNILNFRFGNDIFEPLINKDYIDHIQITAAEDFGIGQRGGYYDTVGALKDVGQNHLLQMLALTTMDAPLHFSNEEISKERIKLLQSIKPLPDKVVFGQYEGYLNEDNVNKSSTADTYFAFKTYIKNERFSNVPIYIRGGKRLKRTVTEISFVFKQPVNRLFREIDCGMEYNVLTYRIQPNEGIVLKILVKSPGHEKKIEPSYMQFCYKQLEGEPADPYEKLIVDALNSDQTFFNDAEEVEAQWAFIDTIFATKKTPVVYKPGTWGPSETDEMLKEDGKKWIEPSIAFCKY